MSQSHKRVRRTREQIEDLLDRYEARESTQVAFAKEHELSLSTLQFWLVRRRREARASAPASRFVPVSITQPTTEAAATGLELELANGRRLHIAPDIDCDALARLLPVIAGAC